jgi:hypothetical protein
MGLSNFSVSPSSHQACLWPVLYWNIREPKEHACPLSSWRVTIEREGEQCGNQIFSLLGCDYVKYEDENEVFDGTS